MTARPLRLAVIAAALAVGACGGSTATTTPSPSTRGAGTPSGTPSQSGLVVWTVTVGSSTVVRTLTPAGGGAHTVATLGAVTRILGVAAGKLVYLSPEQSLHIVTLATGTDASFFIGANTSANLVCFGAAISPDGTRVAYMLADPSGGRLSILTLATGGTATIRTYPPRTVDVPIEWTATSIVATTTTPFSDAFPEAAVGLDPATGTQVNSTKIVGAHNPAYSEDGVHAAYSSRTPGLGDESDGAGSQIPIPLNTVRTLALGSSPIDVAQKAHHHFEVLAVSRAGTQVLYSSDSSAGGFAGISMSPDFGLFTYSAGTATQLEKLDGPRWDAAAFIDDNTAFAARHVGSNEELTLVGGSHTSPSVVDTVSAGDQPVFVGYSPTS
jgi:hypothetical protein